MSRFVLPALEPCEGPRPPTVRIFVGSEPHHLCAERAFAWSVARCRDRARRYEIEFMRDLPGFDRRRWPTGFTNYRFAVPERAGGVGRAIYNDVDQIYLEDPAGLFDLPLAGKALLALETPGGFDSAVMLLNCGELKRIWGLADAQRLSRRALEARAREAGCAGPLPQRWHVRDHEWDDESSAALVHYTTLHTQPWKPRPDVFAYREAAGAGAWLACEAAANAAGFELPLDAEIEAGMPLRSGLQPLGASPWVEAAVAGGASADSSSMLRRWRWDVPATGDFTPWHKDEPAAEVLVLGPGFAHQPFASLRASLALAFASGSAQLFVEVDCIDDARWSLLVSLLREASRRAPGVAWKLADVRGDRRSLGGLFARERAPRILWLDERAHRPGAAPAAHPIAAALESRGMRVAYANATDLVRGSLIERTLRRASGQIASALPDLLIATGPRGARVAKRLPRSAAGRWVRRVGVGVAAAPFDLVVRPDATGGSRRAHWIDRALRLRGSTARGTPRPLGRIASRLLRGLSPGGASPATCGSGDAVAAIEALLGLDSSC